LVGCGPDGIKEDVSSHIAWEGRESERGTVCEGPASHTNVMIVMLERGVNHHFVFPQGKRSVEDEGLRRDGRRNKVRECLNVPGGILRGGVAHLEHGKDVVLGVGARCPWLGRGELEVRLPLRPDVRGVLRRVSLAEKARGYRSGGVWQE
jgi:hypothetical protein